MAKIRDYAVTIYAAATASMVCEMPEHATGDLLVAFVNKDTASDFTTPSGWTAIQTQTSAGAGGGVYGKRATSAAETVTFTLTSETCIGVIIAVQDCYGSTVADAVPTSAKSGADDATLPLAGIGLTTAYANSLLLHGLSTDSGGGFNALPPWINLFAGDTGANSLCVSYSGKEATGAVTAPNHWGGLPDDSRGFMIEVRDGSSGASMLAYLPLSTTPASQITPLNGSTGVVDKGTWAAAGAPAVVAIAGRPVTGLASATTADSGINPFRGSERNVGATSATGLDAVSLNLTSTFDATALEGLLFGTYMNLAPRDYVDTGNAAQGGKFILAGSDASNYKAWVVGGQFSKTERPDARNNYLIELGTTDTAYDSVGTANFAALDILMFGSAGRYGSPSVLWNELYLLGVANIAGGSSTSPIGMEDVVFVINNGCGILPLMQQAGSGVTCWIPIQFGGTEKIGIACNLNTFQYPRKADEIDYVDFHVSNNKVGFEFYGTDASDYLHFTNSVFTSPSQYYWRFNANHSASADIDFGGTSVVGATVTLQSTVMLDNMVFIGCPGFTQNGATITNTRFTDTKITSASLADMDNISDCAFTSSGTGHAIEVGGAAGTITMTGNTFTGYAASNGSTGNEAIYINIATGTVTLNISGGGSSPSIRTAGATVAVNNSVDFTFTIKDEAGNGLIGYEYRLYVKDPAAGIIGTTELDGNESYGSSSRTYSYNYTANTDVVLQIIKDGYEEGLQEYTLTNANQSVTLTLRTERNI